MAITTWAATTGDWDDSKFDRAWDGPNIAPAVGSLSLSAAALSLKIEYLISPAKGDVELIQSYEWDQMGAANWNDTTYSWDTGPSPNVNIGTGISPAKADLTITGQTPAQGIVYTFPVANADLTVTGKIPQLADGTIISPDKGDLEVLNSHTWNNYGGTWAAATTNWNDDSFAPDAVETGQNQPDKADLTLTPHAPRRTESIGFPITKGDLTLAGQIPVASENETISPAKGDLTLTGSIPSLNFYYKVTPAKGDVTITGSIPSAVEDSVGNIPKGDLALTGYAPPFGISHFRSPAKASITGLSSATWDNYGGTWAESSDTWGVGTLSPTVGITYTFPIDEVDLTLDGYSPSKTKKDPTYLANIMVS